MASASRGPERAEGHVGHDVDAEVGEPGDTRILHSAVVDPALPPLVRLEDDPAAFHRHRHPLIEQDLGEADAGVVALCHHPGEQVQPTVGTVSARRVEDALGFFRPARLRDHHGADPAQAVGHVKRAHPAPFRSALDP